MASTSASAQPVSDRGIFAAPSARLAPPVATTHRLAVAAAILREHGLRLSSARRLVIEALIVADGPMSAEQIAAGIGGRVPRSDRGSVYRNLERLEQIGLVAHVHLGDGPGLYSLTLFGDREFLACTRCGDYSEVEPRELDEARRVIEDRFGYRVRFSHFALLGLCSACAADVAVRPRRPHLA